MDIVPQEPLHRAVGVNERGVVKYSDLENYRRLYLDKNSSGDEIANVLVNDDIAHT